MIIRAYKPEDFQAVIDLLIKCNVEPPVEATDLKGFCIVAEEAGQIVGSVWALAGLSTFAYINFFAVESKYQTSKIGWNLLKVMDKTLMMNGVHRYDFHVEPDNKYFLDLIEKYKKHNNVQQLRDLKYFRREIGD